VSGDVVNTQEVSNPRYISILEDKLLVSTFGIHKQLLYTINYDGTLTQLSVDVFQDISQSMANTFHNGNILMTGTGSDGQRSLFGYDENYDLVMSLNTEHTSFITQVVSYGGYLITNSNDKTFKIWEPNSQTLVKTIDTQVISNAIDVKDGYIFNFNRDDGTIDIRDFNKVITENDDQPINNIPVPYDFAGNYRDALSVFYDSELQQLVLHGAGKVFYWEYSTGNNESGNNAPIENPIPASIEAGVNWIQLSTGKYIHASPDTMNFQESRDYCYGLVNGGVMAVPDNDEENTEMHTAMKDLVSMGDWVYLGVQRDIPSPYYYRTDGEELTYEDWCSGAHSGGINGAWVTGTADRAFTNPFSYQDNPCWNDVWSSYSMKAGCQYVHPQ